jgi:hypothetical protein
VNCWVLPFAIEGEAGVITNDVKTGAVTVSVAEPLIVPDQAVMVVAPCVIELASPPLTLATEGADEVQFAVLVRFCVVPLL